jgi:hypothetical protein
VKFVLSPARKIFRFLKVSGHIFINTGIGIGIGRGTAIVRATAIAGCAADYTGVGENGSGLHVSKNAIPSVVFLLWEFSYRFFGKILNLCHFLENLVA